MGRGKGRRKSVWLPDQHGAWAMLAVPFLAGTFLGTPRPAHLPLFAAWLLGYAAVHHAQQWLRLRRASRNPRAPRRHVRPALVFGTACAVLGVPLALAYPWLLLAAACAAPIVAVNTLYARRNRERALLNGLAAVVPACGMLLVAHRLGEGGWGAAGPALACLLYFAGTVPYVKTMIRERNSRAYYRGSVAYHAVAVGAAALLSPWLAVPFAGYLARAVLLPGRGLKPAVVGAVEVVGSLMLLTALLLVY
ncbi:YwiC-like family protein [Streptomyces luteolus]|uniref:YwiC-like family protein n=1 Tax=Streptomyces luteolus TaxID=3043615 RepID=A0ABT6SPJ3_9ACTN|nr:YwiC-like family protein [Streptomyces sp. B-S-A12]MDI3417008.1 YwiC-like family protein [Streptomyces sp. B-S-A12]